MSTEIILSDKAFMSILLSSIEVYKNECLGVLLGHKTSGRIIVEYAIPLQSADRKPSEVASNWRREAKVLDVLPELIHFEKLGYYHSHPQWGKKKEKAKLSDVDKDSMNPGEIELVVAINDKKQRSWWRERGKRIKGTLGNYSIEMAGYYLRVNDGKFMLYRLVCPYAVGFDQAFTPPE